MKLLSVTSLVAVAMMAHGIGSSDSKSTKTAPGQVISGVTQTPSNRVIANGGIFDPTSGLTVKLNLDALRNAINPAQDAAAASDLKDLTTLAQASVAGLKALEDYEKPNSTRITNGLFLHMSQTQPIFKKHSAFMQALDQLIATAPNTKTKWQVYFQQAKALADTIKQSLDAEIPLLRVHLTLSRDTDLSRIPDAQIGQLPGPQSNAALQTLLTNLGLSPTSGFTLQGLGNALIDKYQKDIQTDYTDLKTQATTLTTGYEAQFNTIATSGDTAATGAWTPLKTLFDNIKQSWTKLQQDTDALLAMSPSSTTSVNGFATQFQLVVSDANSLQALIESTQSTIANAAKGTAAAATMAEDQLKMLLSNAENSVKELLNKLTQDAADIVSSAGTLLGFIDDLQKIGETYQDSLKGEATFVHTAQGLGGDPSAPSLPPIATYDQLTITVSTIPTPVPSGAPTPAPSKQIGDSYTIYAWNRSRFAGLTAVGFFPRAQTQHWQFTPIQGWSYKFVSPSMSYDQIRYLVPGIGLSVEALDQQANGQESVGVGAMITLLDDRIIGGYGYDTSGRGGYWYVGYRFRL